MVLLITVVGLCLPERFSVPVANMNKSDFNQNSFWAYPWGKSITHKGVDIFAPNGTPVHSSVDGLVIKHGTSERAGQYILVLGPKWRIHYFAHLSQINVTTGQYVKANTPIGAVGDTGNAQGKAPHLHFSIYSLVPLPWKIDKDVQSWKKMFFIDPIPYLNEGLFRNSKALSSE